MKKLINLIIALLFMVLLLGSGRCESETSTKIKSLDIGDKFIYQEHVDIARADKDVVVYRLYTWGRYHYYSTTRKDSILYDIRSVVK